MSGRSEDDCPPEQDNRERRSRHEAVDDRPVGYCNPPREYQWPKGHCPNPSGRPRKGKKTVKNPSMPNEFEQRLLEEARKVVGEINGEPIDNLQRLWLRLRANADSPEMAKFVLQQYLSALEKDRAWYEAAVADLLAYKTYWGPVFDLQRKTKRPPPRQYPDPDDILITSPTSFRFLGPVTEQEAQDWEFFRQARQAFVAVAHEIIDWSDEAFSIKEGEQRWAKVRCHYYRVNRHLPAAFKKKYPARFPPFKQSVTNQSQA